LESERRRLDALYRERSSAYRDRMLPLVGDVAHERLSLSDALSTLEREKQDFENAALFESYISVLQSLAASVDLATLAGFGLEYIRRFFGDYCLGTTSGWTPRRPSAGSPSVSCRPVSIPSSST